ncbi:hypothetical protein KC19_VG045000 [Ceratodon purpureus]|uniref:Uncharacterized protein n=1 Tax=Ceratodon purpureus TaxID=3225 RepID=A0A8T0HM02_CERPU|nr:hypothetical protein KC19_VG045000 [Ceratodon purpureus]
MSSLLFVAKETILACSYSAVASSMASHFSKHFLVTYFSRSLSALSFARAFTNSDFALCASSRKFARFASTASETFARTKDKLFRVWTLRLVICTSVTLSTRPKNGR